MGNSKISDSLARRLEASADSARFGLVLRFRAGFEDLAALDSLLRDKGGRRLSEPDIFNSVRIEASPTAVRAIKGMDRIESVIENQSLTHLGEPQSHWKG